MLILDDTKAKIRMRGQKYLKDGETYIKFNDFIVKAKTGAAKLKLDNLFNGDPVLSQVCRFGSKFPIEIHANDFY